MLVQNFIELSAAFSYHELSCARREKKQSDENNTVRRYPAASKERIEKPKLLRTFSGAAVTAECQFSL